MNDISLLIKKLKQDEVDLEIITLVPQVLECLSTSVGLYSWEMLKKINMVPTMGSSNIREQVETVLWLSVENKYARRKKDGRYYLR